MCKNGGHMRYKKIMLICIILLLLAPAISFNTISDAVSPPVWNKNWKFREEIFIPISTSDSSAKYQPIDMYFEFDNLCWGKNEKEHSVRILCWNENVWHELESQVYDIQSDKTDFIKKCGVIFLIPSFADGNERYFICYDDSKKEPTNYPDHVHIEDSYYYFEPISGISAEGDYYKITEDGFVVFGIGQKGKVIFRSLSHTVVKQKPGSKNFGIFNSDNTASFCFSYYEGTEDEDEVSSDQKLISKSICVDGNLMVEFRIVSESKDGRLRTSNVYKYYYCPTENKRVNVHVKHQVFEESIAKGITNIDGRYAALISYQSKSERIEKMKFGEILPFLHIFDEDSEIREYTMNPDPEGTKREWIIPYDYDMDLGEDAWISYDEGKKGKAQALIFSSNKDIVKSGTDERDGIQLKVAEKEYLDAIGAEIDYAAITLGRNSFEKGTKQDLTIPEDFVVEYDAEFFTTETGGYMDVAKESNIFQTLIKHRHSNVDDFGPGDSNIYTLTVIPRFTGRFMSHPFLNNLTGINITYTYADLYKDKELISSDIAYKPLIGAPRIKFPKIEPGKYVVKVYRKILDKTNSFIGVESVEVKEDTHIEIFCTWPKNIVFSAVDQKNNYIRGIEVDILKNNTIIKSNITTGISEKIFDVPFSFKEVYTLKALYKGFEIYNKKLKVFEKNIDTSLDLYDLTVDIRDKLGFSPGVNIRPFLTSPYMDEPVNICPETFGSGRYYFKDLPESEYELHVSYASYSKNIPLNIPYNQEFLNVEFEGTYNLKTVLFDLRGNTLDYGEKTMDVYRNNKKIVDSLPAYKELNLPPGEYTIYVYSDGNHIGLKNVELSNNKEVKIVTTTKSIIPTLFTTLLILFIIEIVVLLFFKKISLNTFLKLIAMSLILLSVFYPWWSLNAIDTEFNVHKEIDMFIMPGSMIETVDYQNILYLNMATIPEIFTNFIGGLLLVVFSGFVLIGTSFIPNIVLKKRYYKVLITASIFFLILVVTAYVFGMAKLTELSLGSLQGQGILEVTLPNENLVYIDSSWGLSTGFYLAALAAITALFAGIIDFLREKKWLRLFFG